MSSTHPSQQLTRLDQRTYAELERQCPKPHCGQDTSPHQAAYLLGVQFVLEKLRTGFVTP